MTLWNLMRPPIPSMPSLTKPYLPTETAPVMIMIMMFTATCPVHYLEGDGSYRRHPRLNLQGSLQRPCALRLHRDMVRSSSELGNLPRIDLNCLHEHAELTLNSVIPTDAKAMTCFGCTASPASSFTSAMERSSPAGRLCWFDFASLVI